MPELLKCTSCRNVLDIVQKGDLTYLKCSDCGNISQHQVINTENTNKLNMAAAFRQAAEFDKALTFYKDIIENAKPPIAEAYYGAFLCEYNILFERNTKQNKKYPVFYSLKKNAVWDSKYLEEAMRLASLEQRESFKQAAESIEVARKEYFKVVESAPNWDVFICFKKSLLEDEPEGGYTDDFAFAQKIYPILSEKFEVFYSHKSLDKLDYNKFEPNIYYALHKAKAMIVIASKKEYLEAGWVKNEWSRFIAIHGAQAVIPIYTEKCDYDGIPTAITQLQGVDARDADWFSKLSDKLDSLVFSEERRKEKQRQEEAQRKRDEEIAAILSSQKHGGVNVKNLALLARNDLEDGKFDEAKINCKKILEVDAINPEARFLIFLANHSIRSAEQLPFSPIYKTNWTKDSDFQRALKNGDENQRKEYTGYIHKWAAGFLDDIQKKCDAKRFSEALNVYRNFGEAIEPHLDKRTFDFYYLRLIAESACTNVDELVYFGEISDNEYFRKAKDIAKGEQLEKIQLFASKARSNAQNIQEDFEESIASLRKDCDLYLEKNREAVKKLASLREKREGLGDSQADDLDKQHLRFITKVNGLEKKRKELEDESSIFKLKLLLKQVFVALSILGIYFFFVMLKFENVGFDFKIVIYIAGGLALLGALRALLYLGKNSSTRLRKIRKALYNLLSFANFLMFWAWPAYFIYSNLYVFAKIHGTEDKGAIENLFGLVAENRNVLIVLGCHLIGWVGATLLAFIFSRPANIARKLAIKKTLAQKSEFGDLSNDRKKRRDEIRAQTKASTLELIALKSDIEKKQRNANEALISAQEFSAIMQNKAFHMIGDLLMQKNSKVDSKRFAIKRLLEELKAIEDLKDIEV